MGPEMEWQWIQHWRCSGYLVRQLASILFVCWLLGCLTSQQHASVSQGRICSDMCTCCHTETGVAKPSMSPSHNILTPGQPVEALTLWRQSPGRVATGVPILKSLVWLDPGKSRRRRESNPGSAAFEADALTTRPTKRLAFVQMVLS